MRRDLDPGPPVCVLSKWNASRRRRRSGERDVHVTGSHGTAEHRVRRRRVRKERGGRGGTPVSRGKVGSTPGTGAGDRILPEGRTSEAISSGFRMQRLPLRRRRPEKEEGHFAAVDRADGAGVYGNERVRRRHRRTNDPGGDPRRCNLHPGVTKTWSSRKASA
jgi:hypothetical protein